jgi:hypothetical protein
VNATHHHTSAKLNKGLDVAFVDLARRMGVNKAAARSAKNDRLQAGGNSRGGRGGNKKLLIVEDNVQLGGGRGQQSQKAAGGGGCC